MRRVLPALPLVLVWTLAAIAWQRLWVFPTLSNDDLFFMTRNEVPPTELTWRLWRENLSHDLARRNGRSADAVAQLVFALGPTGTRLVMAGVCWATCLLVWLWARQFIPADVARTARGRVADALAVAGALTLPTACSFWDRWLDSTTLYFMAATIGYPGGLALFLAATLPLSHALRRPTTRPWLVWLSLPVTVVTAYHHEILALMLAGFAATALLCWPRCRYRASTAAALLLTVGISLYRLTTPGLQRRRKITADVQRQEPHHLQDAVFALAHFQQRHWGYLLLLAGAVVLVGLAGLARGSARRWVSLAGMTLTVTAVSLWCWLGDRTLAQLDARDVQAWFQMPTGWPLVLCFVGLWLGGVLTALAGRRPAVVDDGEWPLVLVLAPAAIAPLVPFALRGFENRPLFFAYAMFLLTGLCAAVWVVATGRLRPVSLTVQLAAVVMALVALGPGTVSWYRAWHGLQENHATELWATQQLEMARDHQLYVVVLPRTLPRTDYASNWPGFRDSSLGRIRTLYQLEENVSLSWGD
ncbi:MULTISPECIES: hypothetical protein [unclassified Luteococcus]|uniref:hypothetical protein n=1 Tax=unclassified Luteococcus TaxID=2639923 RepID=UPI00313B88E3